jgi:hypothetical protein
MIFKEFKCEYYNFEYAKLFLKILIVLVTNLIDEFTIVLVLITIFMLIYFERSLNKHPYQYFKTQQLDLFEVEILIFTIQIGEIVNRVSAEAVKVILEMAVLLLNASFFARIALNLLRALMIEMDLTPLLLKCVNKFPRLTRNCNVKEKNLNVFLDWKLIKKHRKTIC